MSTPTVPRGIRNANPGNIRWGSAWQGLKAPAERTDPSFCQFVDPVYGIRAIAKIMLTYADAYNLRTVQGVIGRWAPPNENNTASYVLSVARSMGVGPADQIDVHVQPVMCSLVKAIIQHENGQQPYPDQLIEQGVALAEGQ
jgi:hypothetical protein